MINPRHPVLIKKYGNRRLYDTEESRYITLDELSAKIQGGTDVRVVGAKGGEDLTQATLTQIVVEGRNVAKLLPVPLLLQLIRLGDDALAEFFGRYVTSALEMYLQAKRGVQTVASYNPLAAMPFAATNALARMWMQSPFAGQNQRQQQAYSSPPAGYNGPPAGYNSPPAGYNSPPAGYEEPPAGATPPPEFIEPDPAASSAAAPESDVAALRRELEELKESMRDVRDANQSSKKAAPRSGASRSRRRAPRKKRS